MTVYTGYIYKIKPTVEHDEGEVYIGSTKKRIKTRFKEHINKFINNQGYYSSFDIFEKYGYKNCTVKRLEKVECTCRKDLLKREAHYQTKIKCVNKMLAYNPLSKAEQVTLYKYKNREQINALSNSKIVCECGCISARGHISLHRKSKKHFNLMNGIVKDPVAQKEKRRLLFNERSRVVVTCECGSNVSRGILHKHRKCKKHINLMALKAD